MQRRQAVLPVLLAVLLTLAGCAGTNQLTSPNEPTEEELPPGVSQSGVESASALVDAHTNALNESGYAYRITLNGTVTAGSGNKSSTAYETSLSQTSRAEASGRPAFVTARTNISSAMGNQSQGVAYWWNDSTTLARTSLGGGTRYVALDEIPGQNQLYAPDERYLEQVVSASNFSVTGVDRSGSETLVTLTATEPNSTLDGVTSYNATLVVGSSGRIHEATQHAIVESEQGTQTVDLRYKLTETSVETVERPPWSDKALANQTSV